MRRKWGKFQVNRLSLAALVALEEDHTILELNKTVRNTAEVSAYI